jgi:hypothetical protein
MEVPSGVSLRAGTAKSWKFLAETEDSARPWLRKPGTKERVNSWTTEGKSDVFGTQHPSGPDAHNAPGTGSFLLTWWVGKAGQAWNAISYKAVERARARPWPPKLSQLGVGYVLDCVLDVPCHSLPAMSVAVW